MVELEAMMNSELQAAVLKDEIVSPANAMARRPRYTIARRPSSRFRSISQAVSSKDRIDLDVRTMVGIPPFPVSVRAHMPGVTSSI